MLSKIVRGIITLLFGAAGIYLNYLLLKVIELQQVLESIIGLEVKTFWTYIIFFILLSVIGFFLAPVLMRLFMGLVKWMESRLTRMPISDLVGGALGGIVGLLIASLISSSFSDVKFLGPILSVIVSLFLGYVGLIIGMKRKEDILGFFNSLSKLRSERNEKDKGRDKGKGKHSGADQTDYKVLDTSVIIDGRIADIVKSGFLDGILLIPGFVLEELRHIADSSDAMKRNRGRRGLDILNQISKEAMIKVEIYEGDFEDIAEVDSKLVKLSSILGAPILTNDYNLNKVAELQGIKVLNINELANAVKPVVLPGEEMYVQIMKEGKENGQGVAYLDDGTMVVVDGGRKHIGQHTTVLVTTVLQTAAGRMIFAKPKGIQEKSVEEFSHEINAFG
ncbi:PIN/TRAM domain-containing protein [Dehalobacter sp. DCM]|uniref:PIN/TRAM domain-containing protein n=1 Tax=Dehalobacter sp. DCM TaxID=2907827 RepID=UPI0030814286|nr:PIN/TRAM domain-containing protein [Dehalobacter sp. DCM]